MNERQPYWRVELATNISKKTSAIAASIAAGVGIFEDVAFASAVGSGRSSSMSNMEFAGFAILGGIAPIVMVLWVAWVSRNDYERNKKKLAALPEQLPLPPIPLSNGN